MPGEIPDYRYMNLPTEQIGLRDWFAGQALAGGLSALLQHEGGPYNTIAMARDAYQIADAMLKAREETNDNR